MENRDLLVRLVKEKDLKVVFAESCTGGMAAALLTQVPGISQHFCGSIVSYRPESKKNWLWVCQKTIVDNSCESEEVVLEMAIGAISKTSEADWSAAIVGHFSPDAPEDKRDTIWISVCKKSKSIINSTKVLKFKLSSKTRSEKQKEAALILFKVLADRIKENG